MVAAKKPDEGDAGRSLWYEAWLRLRRNRMAVVCALLFIGICLFCFVGPALAKAVAGLDGVKINPAVGASPPSLKHWMGTDTLGRDLLLRAMDGGQIAIIVAFVTTAIALVIGVSWGAIAGYVGGRIDEIMMRVVDVMYALPTIIFVIVMMSIFRTKSLVPLFALIGGVSWLTMSRIVRGQVMSLKHREYIEAARCLGVSTPRILFRHIIPNTLGPIVVYTTLLIPQVMLAEAFLSFLGLGVQAPRASWGTLVFEGSKLIVVYPWVLVGPGMTMALTIFSLNFLGDGLRDALDPQTRKV